ncbi:hypothetical protein CLU83_0096 [Flavobacterium sp. 1]|uniref:lipoprotein n=1 Tax=Flavobacterium sp. 1 TaxID=2035200 RepID=UPI000C24AFD8|nr:lipoprotein [Flavobacterium sp. 1]PJJ06970.1 hypothetical protein CLU83_0096 [Flavobacterium sp. 1]
MRKIFFIFFIIFTVSSCTYEDSRFRQISKKEAMQSWAWKIFIFTDEGEFQSVEPEVNKIHNSIKEKPIFAEDIWKTNLKDDLFLKNNEVALEDRTDYANFEITKKKK